MLPGLMSYVYRSYVYKKMKNLTFGLILSVLAVACSSQKENGRSLVAHHTDTVIVQDFTTYFNDCSVEGSIAIYDQNNRKWILSDTVGTRKETLPASTFKIINLLIALETKTISDENEVMKWVGSTDTVKYGYRPEIYRDMTIKEAFEVSAGWVFVELAKKIGKKNYKKYLASCNYGNLDLSQTDADFWNFGNFAISPVNQVEFIKNLYDEKLPFSKRNIEIVKRVMITEQNAHETIHSKTGWTRANNTNTGWWVGYIENKNGVLLFRNTAFTGQAIQPGQFWQLQKGHHQKCFQGVENN